MVASVFADASMRSEISFEVTFVLSKLSRRSWSSSMCPKIKVLFILKIDDTKEDACNLKII